MAAFDLILKLFSYLFLKRKASLIRIKAAKAYVLGVKKTRVFILGTVLVLVSLVLLSNGLSLAHTALFAYSGLSPQLKFIAALLLAALECLGAIVILLLLFREETWVRFTNIKKVVHSVIEKKPGSQDE